MTTPEVKAAAERLRRHKDAHIAADSPYAYQRRDMSYGIDRDQLAADEHTVAEHALPLYCNMPAGSELLSNLGFNVRHAPHGWSASLDVGPNTISVYQSGEWHLTGDHEGVRLPPMPSAGQLTMFLSALDTPTRSEP